jgi:hypothetical protein
MCYKDDYFRIFLTAKMVNNLIYKCREVTNYYITVIWSLKSQVKRFLSA